MKHQRLDALPKLMAFWKCRVADASRLSGRCSHILALVYSSILEARREGLKLRFRSDFLCLAQDSRGIQSAAQAHAYRNVAAQTQLHGIFEKVVKFLGGFSRARLGLWLEAQFPIAMDDW